MSTYYDVIATIDGTKEVLFGSFIRSECAYEIEAERDSWKDQGYKGIKIVSRETDEQPDAEVYTGQIVTKHELWMKQAPSFNFELDQDELLAAAIERGYVTKLNDDQYLINEDY